MSDRIIGRPFQPGQSGNPGGRPKRGWNIYKDGKYEYILFN